MADLRAKTYKKEDPHPLVLSHHGWGGDMHLDAEHTGLMEAARDNGFIAVFVNGYADNSDWPSFYGWNSWNAVGTSNSPSKLGPTCLSICFNA